MFANRRYCDEQINELRELEPFRHCKRREVVRASVLGTPVQANEGRVLVVEGTRNHQCVLIVEGSVRVSRAGADPYIVGRGGFVGHDAVRQCSPNSETVSAITDVRLLVFGAREYATLLYDCPGLASWIANDSHQFAVDRANGLELEFVPVAGGYALRNLALREPAGRTL
jgi:CRP-like cAMP-binding protein